MLLQGSCRGFRNILLLVALLAITGIESCGRGSISLENNEYRKVLIAIGPEVPENPAVIAKLKDVFTKASALLYKVTRRRAFFKEITILVPKTWSYKSEYEQLTLESHDKSDIVVDIPNKLLNHGDKPFVIKATPCGELGYYMHFTPQYLLDESVGLAFGPYEKVLIHEWANFRYGVFAEYPTSQRPVYFYAGKNGEIEATRCSQAIQGRRYDYKTGSGKCRMKGNMPDGDCRFQEDNDASSGYGSLMYKQYLNQVTEFCDNDPSNPKTLHNREAPTRQNNECDGKSIWEVLRNHIDFKDGRNPARSVSSTVPTFKVVREKPKRTILVLDVSGSMAFNDRIRKLRQAGHQFITNMKDDELAAIVWFSSTAKAMTKLLPLTPEGRATLIANLPSKPIGGTGIGGGLRAALKLLGPEPSGGTLLVVSDGHETINPYLRDVRDEVIASHVIVHAIAISSEGEPKLDDLADATGGRSFLYRDTSPSSNGLNEALTTIAQRNTGATDIRVQVESRAETILPGSNKTNYVKIDKTIGRNTSFNFDYDIENGTEVIITTPSGVQKDKSSAEYFADGDIKVIRFVFDNAEAGTWKYQIIGKHSEGSQRVAVSVISSAAKVGETPIIVTAYWYTRGLSLARGNTKRQILYVTVSRGYSPVFNAHVVATIERPDNPTSITLQLFDNGAGADLTKDDGIYSAYFDQFSGNGRYDVKINVKSVGATVVSPGSVVGVGTHSPESQEREKDDDEPVDRVVIVDSFQRVTSGGSFTLEGYKKDKPTHPPSRIRDLRVTEIRYEARHVTLEWTATGTHLPGERATSYRIGMSKDFESLYKNFNSTSPISQDMLLRNKSLLSPLTAGETERFTIRVPKTGNVTYYFAVSSMDGPRESERSNIVSASLKHLKDKESSDAEVVIGVCLGVLFGVLLLIFVLVLLTSNRKGNERRRKSRIEESEGSSHSTKSSRMEDSEGSSQTTESSQGVDNAAYGGFDFVRVITLKDQRWST